MNLVDYLILIAFALAVFDGFRRGLVSMALDLGGLVISVWLAFHFYGSVGGRLGHLGLTTGLQPIAGFILVLLLSDWILRILIGFVGRFLPKFLGTLAFGRVAGAILAAVKQVILVALLLNLLLFLPVIPQIRTAIQSSKLAPSFALQSPTLEHAFTAIITPAVEELQRRTTITEITENPVDLHTPIANLAIDQTAERELFRLVNQERTSRGLPALAWNAALAEVGELHSKDMWVRQYFAHVDPSGRNPFQRLDAAGIKYTAAGENLALAPTTEIAHAGLMASPGHRANILDPDYRKLGIGAVRNGLYGIMFSQEFTD